MANGHRHKTKLSLQLINMSAFSDIIGCFMDSTPVQLYIGGPENTDEIFPTQLVFIASCLTGLHDSTKVLGVKSAVKTNATQ